MFRSRIAEALFKKYNKNKNIKGESAGIFKGDPTDKFDLMINKKFGLKLKEKQRGMSRKLVKSMDLVIIVADDISINIFKDPDKKYMAKVISWRIPDKTSRTYSQVKAIVKRLDNEIKKLIKQLENEK